MSCAASLISQEQFRALNHRFIDTAADASGSLMEALTAQDFLLTEHDGAWHTRAEFLADRRRPHCIKATRCDALQVRQFGHVALVHGVVSCQSTESQVQLRYTDVHVWSGTQWQLVSAQNTRLKPGVAVQQQSFPAPVFEPWAGQDPTGSESDVLHTLNRHYVKAFRDADVAWYHAHLSDDYVVVSGDGSFQDRAAALLHFAQPTFANGMTSFPVSKVNIRRFHDVALIHAENDYQLKDGRKGISRYTDIWHVKNGSWRCVAAHITVFKTP